MIVKSLRDNSRVGRNVLILFRVMLCSVAFFTSSLFGKDELKKKNLAFVSFQNLKGEQGVMIEKADMAFVKQDFPIQIEVYKSDSHIRRIQAGYNSVKEKADGFVAEGSIAVSESVLISVTDTWSFSDNVLSFKRALNISGNDSGGFMSGIILSTQADVSRCEVDYFVPGLIYGSTDHLTPSAIGGSDTFKSGCGKVWIREDRMPAPLFGIRFQDNTSLSVLNPTPDGRTTIEDSHDIEAHTLIDERFQFGSIGSESIEGKLTCGYWLPGTEGEVTYRGNEYPFGQMEKWRRRYHPLKDGLVQSYQVLFRFGEEPDLPAFSKTVWRWTWNTLQPQAETQDIELACYHLIKQLAGEVIIRDGRAGIPNAIPSTPTESIFSRLNNIAVFGFTGKNLESAYFLLKNSYGSNPPYKFEQQKLGRAIIDSFVTLKMNPPVGEGFDISSGEPCLADSKGGGVYLRSFGDGMKAAARAYLLEKQQGVNHKKWLRWIAEFGDWLLTKQNVDGSFPRKFVPYTGEILDTSPQCSYNVIPYLVLLSDATGIEKYLDAAIKAGEYSWLAGHCEGVFIGGTIDNPNVADKEAATLSLEAYLALYEKTKESKWLDRAKMAANFAESWIYLWNVPMPEEEDNSKLHWKKGVSTVGLQLISTGHSLVDQYMAFDADEYVKLWVYTNDAHYYDVALILLHNTKNMLAIPGRTYDLNGTGWQQEHWSLAPPRGFGRGRQWLPWVTCSHLNGIYGIKDFDPQLYEKISSISLKRE